MPSMNQFVILVRTSKEGRHLSQTGDQILKRQDNRFVCERCGSTNLKVLQVNSKTGLYCAECKSFIRWLNRKIDVREAYERLIPKDAVVGKAIKKIIKYGRTTTIRCEKCDCLLFSSNETRPAGQFDLIDAKFCPNCGVEFIDEHKNLYKK